MKSSKQYINWIFIMFVILFIIFIICLVAKEVANQETIKEIIKIENPYEKKVSSYIQSKYKRISPVIVNEISNQIKNLHKNYNVEIPVIMGIMEIESGFNPTLVSNKHARGLMQVRYSVWEKVLNEKLKLTNEFDLHIIKNSIESGLIVLNHYLEKNNNDLDKALFLYCGKSEKYVIKVKTAICNFIIFKEK